MGLKQDTLGTKMAFIYRPYITPKSSKPTLALVSFAIIAQIAYFHFSITQLESLLNILADLGLVSVVISSNTISQIGICVPYLSCSGAVIRPELIIPWKLISIDASLRFLHYYYILNTEITKNFIEDIPYLN